MIRAAVVLVACALASSPASAQPAPANRPTPSPSPAPRHGGEVSFAVQHHENFFQSPKGTPGEDVRARAAGLRLFTWPVPWLSLYADLDHVDYEVFDPARSGVVGLRLDGRRHDLDVWTGYHWDRPTFETGDVLQQADAFRAGAGYDYRVTRDWQLGLSADFQHEDYELDDGRDNDLASGDVSLRYRGFGAAFSPEIGVGYARREAVVADDDQNQRQVWLHLRSRVGKRLGLGVRYRLRRREYVTEVPAFRNFGRRDERHQVVATADLQTGRRLAWSAYYAYEDADSTLDTRDYVVHALFLTARVRF